MAPGAAGIQRAAKCDRFASMSVEEAKAHIDRVDRALRKGGAVEDDDRTVNLTDCYRRYGWGGAGPTPLPEDALKQLALLERTGDDRWSKHFLSNGVHLGLYRSNVGYYWLLRYDGALGQHFLEHAGTAHDVEQRFG